MILPRQRRRPAEEGGPFFGTRRARATWKIEHLPEPNHEQHRFFIYKNHGFLLGQTRFWMGQTVGPTSGGAKDLVELDFGKTGVFSQTSSAWDVRTGSRVRIMIASLLQSLPYFPIGSRYLLRMVLKVKVLPENG